MILTDAEKAFLLELLARYKAACPNYNAIPQEQHAMLESLLEQLRAVAPTAALEG